MQPINHFRAAVYAIIAANKIINSKLDKDKTTIQYSLNIFINLYEQMDVSLNQWIFSCIRMPFLSIINVDDLDLNVSSFGSMWNGASKEATNTYIRLETRLKGFLKNMNEALKEQKIDTNIISYLTILISNESYIPKEFFVLFEYSRLITADNFLKNLNEEHKQMILAVYIFCKIICKNILLDGKFSQGLTINTKTKNNFKMCATVLYRGVIDHFKERCKILRNMENMKNFKEHLDNAGSSSKRKLYDESVKKKPSGEVDKSYLNACKKFNRVKSNNDTIIKTKELNLIKKIVEKMPKFEPDGNSNEIQIILKQVFSEKDMTGYRVLAEKYKFNVSSEIVDFVNRFIKYINMKRN